MRFNEFAIRLGDVKLLDISDGHLIVDRLNTATDDPHFKIEMTGKDLIVVYESLPTMIKKAIDCCQIIEEGKWPDVIGDIERGLIHLNNIQQKDEQIVEANIKAYVYIALIAVFVCTIFYRSFTSPLLDNKEMQFENILIEVVKVFYPEIDAK